MHTTSSPPNVQYSIISIPIPWADFNGNRYVKFDTSIFEMLPNWNNMAMSIDQLFEVIWFYMWPYI